MVLNNNPDSIGQVFTPNFIAEFMVKNVLDFIKHFERTLKEVKVLEPSVGEGIFLKSLLEYGLSCIDAFELDETLKKELTSNYPDINFSFNNFLGSEIKEEYDLIIGNPPYLGQNYNAEIFQDYVKKYPICAKYFVGNMDLFYFFIHLAISKLKPGGILSFITTNYWITKSKKTGIKLLKPHILEECFLLQYIDLSNLTLFRGAQGQLNCIFVLQKKTEQQKKQKTNIPIDIIQIRKKNNPNQADDAYNQEVFKNLISKTENDVIINYISATFNNDLDKEGSWNLLYPEEVKEIVGKIEDYCKADGKVSYLKDIFLIRNGMILIKDEYFILNEGKNLKIEEDNLLIKVADDYIKLLEVEKQQLKKIYKSRSIKPYSYEKDDPIGYVIYINKNKFDSKNLSERNILIQKEYPNLSRYINQYENELKTILINAKENQKDIYFPRRGAYIRKKNEENKEILFDLEPLYDKANKIFFKYISSENMFGYTEDSYYATSDTYFLWPKKSNDEIDYPFILAYLNSKLVNFLFKAKNISIKRSKTKLEELLPIPNLNRFTSEKDKKIIEIIRSLSLKMIKTPENLIIGKIDELFFQLFNLNENKIDPLINKFYQK